MPIISNFREVVLYTDALKRTFDLRERPGTFGGSTGEVIATAVADAIVDRTVRGQVDPDGAPLPPLSAAYLEAKVAAGYPGTVGVREHVMLDPDEVRGEVDVLRDTVRMVYGRSEEAVREAGWFQEGDPARGRPARVFYGIGDRERAAVDKVVEDTWENQVRSLGV